MLSTTRLEKLLPRVRLMACFYGGRDPMLADDFESAMLEGIWLKCDDRQSNAAILTKANWIALENLRKAQTYNRHVAPEGDITQAPTDDDLEEAGDPFEYFLNGAIAGPEEEQERRETVRLIRDAIACLPPNHRNVIAMLYIGKSKKQIADSLSITKSAISHRVRNAAKKLEFCLSA